MSTSVLYVINNIALPFNASSSEAFSVAKKRLKASGINTSGVSFSIFRRSVDARQKNGIKFVYSVSVEGITDNISADKLERLRMTRIERTKPFIEYGDEVYKGNAVIVGSGPCGMFCALLLAEQGYKPIIIERGGTVEERKRKVEQFKRERKLDTDTNIQFGAGGAGTFSDGKLITRIGDPLSTYVLEKLVEFGAPKEILYLARPHVGTDILSVVVERILDRVVSLGGKVLYNTTFIDYELKGNKVVSVKTSAGDIPCSELVLAIGHSSRDTYKTLLGNSLDIIAKPFSVGMRIEHPHGIIDRAMYGDNAGNSILGHAEYNLSYNTKARGIYTFCMCPGGVVVPATSEEYGVVTNGMSYHARDGANSNSAICCSIFNGDHDGTPMGAIELQRGIERAAYIAAGKNYSAPIITVGDFLLGRLKNEPTDVTPTYMDGVGVALTDPKAYLPEFVASGIRNGILDFNKKIHGFASPTAVLTGPETRTSAPVRILRDSASGASLSVSNLYPSGEGAGYAGGITSAAIDGLKTALKIIKRYKPVAVES